MPDNNPPMVTKITHILVKVEIQGDNNENTTNS